MSEHEQILAVCDNAVTFLQKLLAGWSNRLWTEIKITDSGQQNSQEERFEPRKI